MWITRLLLLLFGVSLGLAQKVTMCAVDSPYLAYEIDQLVQVGESSCADAGMEQTKLGH